MVDDGSSKIPPDGAFTNGSKHLYHFLRFSHIFASVIREILETRFLEEVCAQPLSRSQFHLLKLISLNGQHQVGEAAEFLGVTPPAATQNIDKLVRQGLLLRTPSKGDRRAVLLSASAKGRRLVQRYEELKRSRLTPILAEFTREELEQLTHLLERFSLAMIRQEQASDGLCMRCAAYWDEQCPINRVRGDCSYQRVRTERVSVDADQE